MADQQNKKSKNTGGGAADTAMPVSGGTEPNTVNTSSAGSGINKQNSFDSPGASQGGAATATAKSFYDQAKETASQAVNVVTDKATTKLDEQKSTLTEGLSTVADTIRQAGGTLSNPQNQSGLTQTAAKYTDTAAQKVDQVAQYFEQRDVKQMVRDVEGYARRNPAVFIGAAFAAGILLSRFFKAGTTNYVENSGEDFTSGRAHSHGNIGDSGRNPNSQQLPGNTPASGSPETNRL